jgi:hypothetical protein
MVMNLRRWHFLLLGVIFSSASVLLIAGSWFCYTSTFDTATVGLMSVNILQGDRPLFFYGQPYFGALEAYFGAFYLSLFGFSEFVLSLSPISFTLGWIFFTYLLFSRIHNKDTGLIAAASVAFSGYYVFWYSISTYGGYSALLCIGTAILWLSLCIWQDKSVGWILWMRCAVLGFLMALGIWVHALTYPYIAIAAVMLCIYLWQKRFNISLFFALCLAAGIGLTGFIPCYIETGTIFGGVSESVPLSSIFVVKALLNLFTANIHELIVWNFLHSFNSEWVRFLIAYGGIAVLMGGFLLAFFACIKQKDAIVANKYYLVPLSFCLLFLVLYVQHHMATVRAPRYAINFWTLLLCTIWSLALTGQRKGVLKKISILLFAGWVLYQISGTIYFIAGNSQGAREEQQTMEAIVRAAQEKGLTSVVTYGDSKFGYKAQKLSMFSGNNIAFANAGLERYKENAQRTERDSGKGYVTQKNYEKLLEEGLKAAGVHYTTTAIGDYTLFSDLQTNALPSMELISASEILPVYSEVLKNSVKGQWLIDRNQDVVTPFADLAQKSVTFDTGKQRMLTALWLFNSQVLPNPQWQGRMRFEVYISSDNVDFKKVYTSHDKAANIFHAGSHIYLSGVRTKNEAIFPPQSGRYVRIVFLELAKTPPAELFIFQEKKKVAQKGFDDIVKIQTIILEQDVDFVLADRWVSARLRELFKGTAKAEIALPRYSLRYKKGLSRYFVEPQEGQAMVCDSSVADACIRSLRTEFGTSVVSRRIDLQEYTMLLLSAPGKDYDPYSRSALLWNGHLPLQTKNIELIAPLLNARGIPVWQTDFTATRGFYHDTWSNGNGRLLHMDYTLRSERDKGLVIYTNGWRPGSVEDLGIKIIANKDIALSFQRKEGTVYFFSLPVGLNRLESLDVISSTFVPNSSDTRKLGLDVKRIEIQ